MDKGADNRQFLFHTMRIGRNQISKGAGDFESRCIIGDTLFPVRFGNPENIGDKIQILDACQIFIEVRIVRNIGNPGFTCHRIFLDGNAVNANFPGFKIVNANHGFDGCRFTGAVMADKTIDIAAFDFQAQIGNGRFAAAVGFC